MSAEITYLDMELYLNYSILISNSVPTFIISICDNLIKCNKLIQNNKISYMYRIPIYKLESGINLELNSDTNYKKYYNNDDFVIPKNNDSGTATIAVNVAKNSVFLSLSSSKSITVRDLSMPDEFRPEKD